MKLLDQHLEMVPLDRLALHPTNPREGDVGAIWESITENGFYGAVIVQKSSGRILAGNHRYLAAKEAGADEIPAFILDVDDERALRILLADNRTNDLASYDEVALAQLLEHLASTDTGLSGTGYDGDDLDQKIRDLQPDEPEVNLLDQGVQLCPPKEYALIVCDTGEQWEMLRSLLSLGMVRRGGYKEGSVFDDNGVERVVPFSRFVKLMDGDLQPTLPPVPPGLVAKPSRYGVEILTRPGTIDADVIGEIERPANYLRNLDLQKSDVVLDVGGHIGCFATIASTLAGAVHTFEPMPENYEVLEANIARNKIENVFPTRAAVVADDAEEIDFYLAIGDNTGNHTVKKTRGRKRITVPAVNINELVAAIRPTKIKMDCETAEVFLIPGIEDWSSVEAISLEFHNSMLGDAAETEYYAIIHRLESIFPVVEYSDKIQGAWCRMIHARR